MVLYKQVAQSKHCQGGDSKIGVTRGQVRNDGDLGDRGDSAGISVTESGM